MKKFYLLILALITFVALNAQVTVTPPRLLQFQIVRPQPPILLSGDITIAEGSAGDISGTGDFILAAPTNFEFQPGTGTVNTTGGDLTASITVTATTITINITGNLETNIDDITISNIQVRGITTASGPAKHFTNRWFNKYIRRSDWRWHKSWNFNFNTKRLANRRHHRCYFVLHRWQHAAYFQWHSRKRTITNYQWNLGRSPIGGVMQQHIQLPHPAPTCIITNSNIMTSHHCICDYQNALPAGITGNPAFCTGGNTLLTSNGTAGSESITNYQ